MKKGGLLVMIFLLSLVLSCDEDDGTLFSSTFYRTKIVPFGSYHLYASGGEIKDNFIVRKFISNDTAIFRMIASSLEAYAPGIDTVWFKGRHDVTVKSGYSTRKCDVATKPKTVVLTSRDTTGGYSQMNEKSRHVSHLLAKEKPTVFGEYISSSTFGNYQFGYKTREVFVFNEVGSRLSAPHIMYRLSYRHPNGFSYGQQGAVNNHLQEDFYKDLLEGDTVGIMEYWLWLERQKQ